MVSAMHAQRFYARDILLRARALGRRTFVGGPWASSGPEVVLEFADHVMVGEAEEAFAELARSSEARTRDASRLARAELWIAQGRLPAARAELCELSSSGATRLVRDRAAQALHALQ